MPTNAFYEPTGPDRVVATEHTSGPWVDGAQHGGPPSALLARALEGVRTPDAGRFVRVTVEILGPMPVGEITITAGVERPGRSVQLLGAQLIAGGRPVARAYGWCIRTLSDPLPAKNQLEPPPLPDREITPTWPGGYLRAVEWRSDHGLFEDLGPTTVWTRSRYPLVAGEEISPLQRVMLVADSGNGASAELDLEKYWFINPELTVHLHRLPEGAWVAVDARTTIAPDGVGLAESVLYDRQGSIGRGAQALMIGPR